MRATPDRVEQPVLDDLRARLRATRLLPLARAGDWSRGTEPGYLRGVLAYWADGYDWRPHEQRLLALPWVPFGDGHALYRPATAPTGGGEPPVVVLLHGWPDSFLRFDRVLPLLDDVTVVVPCLPGYPYGPTVPEPGMAGRVAMAERVAGLLAELGHDRYVACGGDIGSAVAQALAVNHPDRVAALHLTDIPFSHLFALADDELSPAEREYRVVGRRWTQAEGAYLQQQATKPHTLAVGLGDSPAGLAAWIVEKLRGWSDCDGDVETAFPRDDLLTWLTLYWVTGTIGTSFSAYFERPTTGLGRPVAPAAVTLFEHDLIKAPREYGERVFDIRSWQEEPVGGHFAAWEQPGRFAAGVRRAIALATQ